MSANLSSDHQSPQMVRTLTRSSLIDRINAMKRQEMAFYLHHMYVQPSQKKQCNDDSLEFYSWREKICHWSYSVIDHFNLSRHTVAISLDLFDRFLATRGNKCDGSYALLTSLTTLYIAVKTHESRKLKIKTLTRLSRGQFNNRDIEKMELKILKALSWLVHPPIVVDFIQHLVKLLPIQVGPQVQHKIFELSRYTAELSVCDPFFTEYPPSLIAFAAILNVLEDEIDFDSCSAGCREKFFSDLHRDLNLHRGRTAVKNARLRLQTTLTASGAMYCGETNDFSNSLSGGNKPDEQMRMSSSYDSNDSGRKAFARRDSIDSKGSAGKSYSRRFKSPRKGSLVIPY